MNYERDLTEIPERKKELAKEIKSLEREIKSFNSSREDRAVFLEKHIADLKERAQKKRKAMKAETEAIEQKTVELEALREQLNAGEKAAEASHKGFAGAEADVGKLLDILQQKQAHHAQKQAQVEALKGNSCGVGSPPSRPSFYKPPFGTADRQKAFGREPFRIGCQ